MHLYSGTFGRGANCDVRWIAAESDEQAKTILSGLGSDLRKVHKIREIGIPVKSGPFEDDVDGPGPVVFRGWGLEGAVQSWREF